MYIPDALIIAKQTLTILLPEILILLAATAMMTLGAFLSVSRRVWCTAAFVILLLALGVLLVTGSFSTDMYSSVALNDAFSFYSRLVLILSGLIILGLAHDQVEDKRAPEFFGSLLMISAGAMVVAAANEIVFLFIGLELVSMPTYLLLYLSRRNATTQEAATKYFFLSIFSSGLILYGFAFLYGLTGISNLKALAFLADHIPNLLQPQLALIAVVFIVAGLGFRVAAVPFHFYAPDVYQGSPTVIAALLSWVPKAIGFLAMVRVLTTLIAVGGTSETLGYQALVLGWIISVITMVLGNTVALLQDNLKRLLAYSSIAHAGYLMIGITVAFANSPGSNPTFFGTQGMLFYLVSYALMTLGAFGIIIALSTPERSIETVDDLAGLGQTHPWTALGMAICLFSLAGIPPLAGFYGKFALFVSAFSVTGGGETAKPMFWWLGVFAVLNSAVGAYYYLRIVVLMYLRPAPARPIASRTPFLTGLTVSTCVILTVLLGLFPGPVFRTSREAAQSALALPDPTMRVGARFSETLQVAGVLERTDKRTVSATKVAD